MIASSFDLNLLNLEGKVRIDSLYHIPEEQCYKNLKNATGEDFGTDFIKWLEYGLQHNLCTYYDTVDLANFKSNNDKRG